MASLPSVSYNFFLFMAVLASANFIPASAIDFDVGGTGGWVVPNANNSRFYNIWASKNRFIVGDTINFKYEKDSVMVVNEKDYKQCNANHPVLFSNTGKFTVELNQPRQYYIISGATGHCQRGQKMIIKVLILEPVSAPNSNCDSSSSAHVALGVHGVSLVFVVRIVVIYWIVFFPSNR